MTINYLSKLSKAGSHLKVIRPIATVCLLISVIATSMAQGDDHIKQALVETYIGALVYPSNQKDAELQLVDNYITVHNQVRHLYYQRYLNGIPVDGAITGVHLNTLSNKVWSIQSRHLGIYPKKKGVEASITSDAATARALEHLGIKGYYIRTALDDEGSSRDLRGDTYELSSEPKASLAYYVGNDETLALCWLVNVESESPQYHLWEVFVDVSTGEVVTTRDLVLTCNFGPSDGLPVDRIIDSRHSASCEHQHSTSAMVPSYTVFDSPIESPSHGSRTVVSNPSDSLASPYGWHDDDGISGADYTITRGNNVLAQDDINGNNGSGFSPDAGSSLNFDYTLDLSQDPATNTPSAQNLSASLTNLFYWNNLIHDVFYHFGFDEASGNFQENNYGRGGNGSDYVFADGLDGSGTNNANFGTPSDGNNPRMQMFLWNATSNVNSLVVNSPATLSGPITAVEAAFGDSDYNLTGDLVIVSDGSSSPSQGCGTLTNASAISGKIAVVDRGNCQFGKKAINAENAGAVGVIVCNNVGGNPIQMAPGTDGANVTIPVVMISQSDCAAIKLSIPGVNVTMVATGSAPQLDGSFDNAIIAHEYGHGISNRLTGGPSASGCLSNQEQMGEGWSDFFGLVLTHTAGDTRNTGRGIGTYATGQPTTGDGIRPFRYTADMTVNPSTYDDTKTFSVPHGVGSVWCTMLWDMYWDLVDMYGYDPDLIDGSGGNNIAIQLVIDGLKLQPCSPGFIDGRDAILLADQINYGGVHQCLIWNAFARRGLGLSASQGSTNSRADGVEAYDVPSGVELLSTLNTDQLLDGEEVTIRGLAVCRCTPQDALQLRHVVDSTLVITGVSHGTASNDSIYSQTVNLQPGDTLGVTYTVQAPACSTPPQDTLLYDDVEGSDQWTSSTLASSGLWVTSTAISNSGSTSWYAIDPPVTSDYALTLNNSILLSNNTTLKFAHRYQTETNWDGGVVELSADGGASWQDLGDDMVRNGYPSTMAANGSSNLAGRAAYTGNSAAQFGSNDWIVTEVDLSPYAGEVVLIRFRFASDDNTASTGLNGWYIDDISIKEYTSATIEGLLYQQLVLTNQVDYPMQQLRPDRSVIYVDSSAVSDSRSGTSWQNAFDDLQDALAAANCDSEPKQIWVAKGTYYPSDTGDRSSTFALRSGIAIYGGFTGTETTIAQRDHIFNRTTLSGDIGIISDHNDNTYHIVTSMDVDTTAILDGFTITRGFADDTLGKGGAIINTNGSPRIKHVVLDQNTSETGGGAIYNAGGSLLLQSCTLTNNQSANNVGRAILHESGSLTAQEVSVIEASSIQGGSSVEVNTASAVLTVIGGISIF